MFDIYTIKNLNFSPVKSDYSVLALYLLVAFLLAGIIICASYVLVNQNPDSEKISAYECGFEPYNDSRKAFNVKFCVIAILFLIFDIELMFLIPWSSYLSKINLLSFWATIDFVIELFIGLLYVWALGGLDWKE